AVKPPGEYRVFCIGGSSVRSEIWLNPDGSFPGLLATELWGRLPNVTPQVINAGGGGQGSVQNLEVLREVLDLQPDLIVVYPEGGEKNTIPPSPQAALAVKDDESPLRASARRCLNRLRSYQAAKLAYQALLPRAPAGGDVSSAFSALATFAVSRPYRAENFIRPFEMKLDGVPVLMEHPIPAAEIERAHARFLRNLATMAALCKERGVPLLFVQPVRNLEAVFYLRFHIAPEEIQAGRIAEWRQLYERAVALRHEQRWEQALAALGQLRQLYVEDRDELAAFLAGDCLLQLGRPADALREFERPYLQHPMRGLIERAGQQAGVPVVDPYPAVLAVSTGGIPGYEEFTDSFHPMPKVNRAIAVAIADAMAAAGIGPPQRPADSPERAAASARLDAVVAGIPVPLHTAIVSAILHGDPQQAIALGRTMPEAEMMKMQPVTAVYLGWALAKTGDDAAAREWYRKLREQTSYARSKNLPPLNTDEDIVRNAFAGDVFAWF
ncbi:MAG TPA: tetratricopeptide repeat protein, partial [Planctomycetota bacterium]|nr:tetratricopeptide repeat protein [Planctomycetota bacterium]